jgi:hypothetical protein
MARSVGRVKVTPSNWNQMQFLRPISEPASQTVRNCGTPHLNGAHAGVRHLPYCRATEIKWRMGQSGHAPDTTDQVNRLEDVQARLVHIARTPITQKRDERLTETRDLTGSREVLSNMAAAEDRSREGQPQRAQIDRQPVLVQFLGHGLQPTRTTDAKLGHRLKQFTIILPEVESQEMKLTVAECTSKLDSVDQLDPKPDGLRPGNSQGRHGVMIGDR